MAGRGNARGSLHLATLVIASAASATAAIVTSRVWGPGTFITAALTPVIVAFVTEALRRPSDRVAERVSVVRERRAGDPMPPTVPETASEARLDERVGPAYDEQVGRAPQPPAPEGRPYRTYAEPPPRRLPVAIAVTTGLLAFLVAAAALTLPELLAGDSVTGRDRTTLFGGESRDERRERRERDQTQAPAPSESQPTRTVTTQEQPKTDTGKTQTTTQPKTTPTTTQPQTETAP